MIQNNRFYSGSWLARFTANYKPVSLVVKNLLLRSPCTTFVVG